MIKERLGPLEATYNKLAMLFGTPSKPPGAEPTDEEVESLTEKVIEYCKNPRTSTTTKIQAAIDQGRARHEQLTSELNRLTETLAQLKFTGESSNVGYLVLSPRTGEILAFGGSPEVNELGKKNVVARKTKQQHARRSEEVSLLLAHVTSCINGLMQQTNVAEQQVRLSCAAAPYFVPPRPAAATTPHSARTAARLRAPPTQCPPRAHTTSKALPHSAHTTSKARLCEPQPRNLIRPPSRAGHRAIRAHRPVCPDGSNSRRAQQRPAAADQGDADHPDHPGRRRGEDAAGRRPLPHPGRERAAPEARLTRRCALPMLRSLGRSAHTVQITDSS